MVKIMEILIDYSFHGYLLHYVTGSLGSLAHSG